MRSLNVNANATATAEVRAGRSRTFEKGQRVRVTLPDKTTVGGLVLKTMTSIVGNCVRVRLDRECRSLPREPMLTAERVRAE